MPEVKQEVRNLATKITEAERQQYQGELLANLERLDEIELRFSLEIDRFKGMLTEAEGKSSQTRTILRSGEHYRDIQCDIRFNVVDLTEDVYRTDTGERISTRVLTSSEIARYSQQSLLIDDDQRSDARQ